MSKVKQIVEAMVEKPSEDGVDLIQRAYDFSEKAHEGHTRYSGEPYFTHCVATATTLAEIGMGPRSIAAGLLHDTIEDTEATAEDIKNEFGEEILFLVEGVTKLGHLRYRGAERHAESLRKLFVATAQDIRVIIVKLADRLHNIQTLKDVPTAAKRNRIAKETLEIYVPLAYRLGVRALHRELEDNAFREAYPEEYEETAKQLKQRSPEALKRLNKIHRAIRKEFAKEGLTEIKTHTRIKALYSLYQKIQRKESIDDIYDIAAMRVIVKSVSDCYRALGIIHGHWRPLPDRIRDYIAFPKPNGYQSIHTTIFTGDGGLVEVQIRSNQMHKEAEFGVASHVSYKEGRKARTLNPNLQWLKQLLPAGRTAMRSRTYSASQVPTWVKQLATENEDYNEPSEYIKQLKVDFFQRRLFVFTPKGDVIDLPIDSSPIDFAYAVHTDIGNHMSGAKVNGKMVSLDTHLENGDIVEIETKKTTSPTQKWLDIAKTSLAKRHIKQLLAKQETV